MLSKKTRLTTRLFDQVFKTGRVFHSRSFWMRSALSPTSLSSRFAVVVPKKVAPTAVLRNKIKRIVYRAIEVFDKNILTQLPGQMIIFGVKNDIFKTPFTEVVQELKDLQLKKGQK
jgi:ribonuclease P protein component